MSRSQTKSESESEPAEPVGNTPGDGLAPRRSIRPYVGMAAAVIAVILWYMHNAANDLERERTVRAVPGGDEWMTKQLAWIAEGKRHEKRTIWLGVVDELVRTRPENGTPELIAVKLEGVERVAGAGTNESGKLFVNTRGFDFAGSQLDEPLSGQRWAVSTSQNVHDHRDLVDALPAPTGEPVRGEKAEAATGGAG